jgi:prepilin-type N-terminal cleavage/methylation domain-containing protein
MQLSKQKGFTLVEIAIVLVIVGLLIGGVLKGQEMITNAKLKRHRIVLPFSPTPWTTVTATAALRVTGWAIRL